MTTIWNEQEWPQRARYRKGAHVTSQSGLTYQVLGVRQLDLTGETFAYHVRRLRGGQLYGATRFIPESALRPEYDEGRMFPFASKNRVTS